MGRFPFNKNSGLKFRKFHVPNGTVHSCCTDTPDASHRAFDYCSCKQDTKERFWGQQFLSNGKGRFGPTDRNDQTGQRRLHIPSKLVLNIPVGPNRNGPFHLMYQPKFPEFWVELKAPTLSFAYSFFAVFPAGPFLW